MTARILDLSADEYHADRDGPSLSASIAHTLVTRSPLHAWLQHPRLGGQPREATKEMDNGSLLHRLILGAGKDIVAIDAEDYRSKAAREARESAREQGAIPVLERHLRDAHGIAERMRENIAAFGIELNGDSEVTVFWEESSQHGPIACRGMPDHLILAEGRIYDLKIVESAHPGACARHMVNYGSDIQWAAYTNAIEELRPELAGRTEFTFLFCEKAEPFCVTPACPDGSMRELGRMRWERAIGLWADCMNANHWPGYVQGIARLAAPKWMIAGEMAGT